MAWVRRGLDYSAAGGMDTADLPLGSYRALDLTEGGFNWCGKVLADLGADVIKVEPPGGSPTRRRGPFYEDSPHTQRSLFWYSYCVNKRGITLGLDTRDGRELFKKLAAGADFVLESFSPGHMHSLGLGYDVLSRLNPGLIMASMAPFGQTGPYAHYKATDMVGWAIGGSQYLAGDEDRPPIRIGFPQAELHAGGQAVAGSMAASWHRQNTGEGQHVDVSMQVAVVPTLMSATHFAPLHHVNVERSGAFHRRGGLHARRLFPCKDGYVYVLVSGGQPSRASTMIGLVNWMDEEGGVPEVLKDRDWTTWDFDTVLAGGDKAIEEYQKISDTVGEFLATKTKVEVFQRAVAHRMLIAPCNTVQDIWENSQFRAREFWVELEHPEQDVSLPYLGPFLKLSESPMTLRRRAPLIGEHNRKIYLEELGLRYEQLAQLVGLGVI